MAVNGVEIKVGQKWRTTGGREHFVTGLSGEPGYAFLLDDGISVTHEGKYLNGGAPHGIYDLIELIEDVPQAQPLYVESTVASGGGKLTRSTNYYQVSVDQPIDTESQPYVAECADIIEALNMTFNEGEAFKAIWRLAAARQGRGKAGNKPEYDADKAAHYGARIAAQVRKGGAQ